LRRWGKVPRKVWAQSPYHIGLKFRH
jgi:hypothetical protein